MSFQDGFFFESSLAFLISQSILVMLLPLLQLHYFLLEMVYLRAHFQKQCMNLPLCRLQMDIYNREFVLNGLSLMKVAKFVLRIVDVDYCIADNVNEAFFGVVAVQGAIGVFAAGELLESWFEVATGVKVLR